MSSEVSGYVLGTETYVCLEDEGTQDINLDGYVLFISLSPINAATKNGIEKAKDILAKKNIAYTELAIEGNIELVGLYGIVNIPTLILFNNAGVVKKYNGIREIETI